MQDSSGYSIYENAAVRVFFATDNLHLLDCSVTWSLLTRTDADWTCWLTADARVRKHKHKFETDSDSGHPVHRSYTAYKQYTASCPWCVNDGRTAESSAAVSWWHHAQEMLATRFQETAQSEQHWHFECGHKRLYLSQTQNYQRMHNSFECALKMGAEGMFWSSKLQVKYKRNDHMCNHSGVARKDSSIIWSAIVNR